MNNMVFDEENFKKGVAFERKIIGLFNLQTFAIHDWTRDIWRKHGDIKVESDSNPDLVIRHKPSNEKFAIECKFRSEIYQNAIRFDYRNKIDNYIKYSQDSNIPVFVVIGIGKDILNIDRMFCIPLEEATLTNIKADVYERFERKPDLNFRWMYDQLT
jgi:hypothetical protein